MTLRFINILLHLTVFMMVLLLGHYSVTDILLIFETQIVVLVVTHFALVKASARKANAAGALTIGFIIFFWVGYVSKLGLGMVMADQFWVVPKLVGAEQLKALLPQAFFLSSLGFISLLFGILTFPLQSKLSWKIVPFVPRTLFALATVSTLLVLKYILKSRYNLGVPGLDPEYLGVPYLAGVLTLIIGSGFLLLANIPLFFALYVGSRYLAAIALLVALANAGIDLMFGSKSTIMYQIVLTIVYIAIFRYGGSRNTRSPTKAIRVVLVLTIIIGAVTAVSYKYMNFFRFALLSGINDTGAAIVQALQSDIANSRSSWIEMYNRITGLETVGALIGIANNFSTTFTLMKLVDGSVVERFTTFFMGTSDAKTLFAVTQFGYFYLVGGYIALIVGSFLLGTVFSLLQYLVLRMRVHHNLKIVFLPVLWVFFVQVLGGGGNFILWAKQITMIFTVFYFSAHFFPANRKPVSLSLRKWSAGIT